MYNSLANRRRILEEERKKRIFDEKTRRIGVDVKALNEQMDQKLARKKAEKLNDMRIEQEILENDRKALQYQAIEDENRKMLRKQLALGYIRPKTSAGIRTSHVECKPFYHEYHVSSAQKFDGEDPDWKTNQRQKAVILRRQLDLQLAEKNEINRKIAAENQLWDNVISYQSNVGRHLENEERHVSRMLKMTCLEENLRLVRDKNLRKAFEDDKVCRENQMDIANQVCSHFLSESRLQAKSLLGNHRILPDRWKGMDEAEKEAIFQEQHQQTQHKAFEKERLSREKKSNEDQINGDVHWWRLQEKESRRNSKDEYKRLSRFNQQLAIVQKAKIDNFNRQALDNIPTEDFFNQFGTSIR